MKRALAPVLLMAGALLACEPQPDAIELSSRPDVKSVRQRLDERLVEGDLLVIDAVGVDSDGDRMELCMTSISSDPEIVEVLPARGNCRVFVLLPKRAGHARVSFTAREVSAYAEIDVTSAP